MNPYPGNRSILVMDNCRIHHNVELVDIVNAAGMSRNPLLMIPNLIPHHQGCLLIYLPAYSPDLNPIEESFSTCESLYVVSPFQLTTTSCSKSFSSPTWL
jgi:transposase